MKTMIPLMALALIAAADPPTTQAPPSPTPPVDLPPDSEDDGGRIVGGERAAEQNIEWQIELLTTHIYTPQDVIDDTARGPDTHHLGDKQPWEQVHRCGGAYIGDGWILTAAHCLEDIDKDANFLKVRQVRMGALNLAGKAGGTFAIDRAVTHKDFVNAEPYPNDIALIHIAIPRSGLPTGVKKIDPFDPARGDRPLAPTDELRATGWGLSMPRKVGEQFFAAVNDPRTGKPKLNTGNPLLQQVALNPLPATSCAVYPGVIAEKTICAASETVVGGETVRRDTCNGDSGGPLTRAQGTKRVLVGLVSWGRGCAQKGLPGVYTRVDAYRDWIVRAKAAPATGNKIYVR